MPRYIAFRVLQVIPTLLVIAIANFIIIHLAPGDPAQIMAGDFATPEIIQQTRIDLGLDQPLMVQLLHYLVRLAHGDLGFSCDYNKPVLSVILTYLPATLLLVLSAQILGIVLGVLVGLTVARRQGSLIDHVVTACISLLYSLPVFWIGLIGILLFGVKWRILPTSGMTSFGVDGVGPQILDVLRHLILPAGTLMLVWIFPIFFRISRASLLETSSADFVTTARAKGLSEPIVFRRHVLRNALLPTVTLIGLTLGTAASGAVLTEILFSWPGIGRLMLEAVSKRDYPMLMGIFLFGSASVVVAALMTDIVYRWLDPRVEYARQ